MAVGDRERARERWRRGGSKDIENENNDSQDVSKCTRHCSRSRPFSQRPAFDQQRSKLDNEHDDENENDSGTVAMDEIDRITIVIYIHIKNMLL